ncbi:MAG: rhodanese-like domain-containing protein [Alphaproteobacteria bacterium]|nr:rhodanese-like domain-containing protein [Alphaproteobacteria bacterium]
MIEDVQPQDTWAVLQRDARAQLVDVRTNAEWTFVGVPDLTPVGKQVLTISWQVPPTMAVNPDFVADLRAAGLGPEDPVYFICRSGARSRAAAAAAAAAGFAHAFNVADGFEGPLDPAGHRGTVAGWKVASLPWRQR